MNRVHLVSYCILVCFLAGISSAKIILYENGDSAESGGNFLAKLFSGEESNHMSWYGSYDTVEPGLQYTNAGILCTSGKAFSLKSGSALRCSLADVFPKEYLDENGYFKPSVKEIWISFLLNINTIHNPKTNYCGLLFRDRRRTRMFFGQENGDFGVNPAENKSIDPKRTVLAETNKTYFLVIKMKCKKYQYFLELWMNPKLDSETMPPVTSDFPAQRHPVQTMVFFARNTDCTIDEIRIGDSRKDVMPSLLFVERDDVITVKGNREQGTGFITKEKEKYYLYTSFDLLIKNKKITFVNQKGKKFAPKKIACATDRDLVRIEIASGPDNSFSIAAPKGVNTPVTICSYNNEYNKACSLAGTLLGVGPDKIEIDAPSETALRGSPILNSDKNVIGASSYARETQVNWVNKDTPFAGVRQFGLRVDNVPKWENIPLKQFVKEAAVMRKKLIEFVAAVSLVRSWAWEPYYRELQLHDDLPKALKNWGKQHNETAIKNNERRKKARKRSMSKDNAKKEMYTDVENECRRLLRLLKPSSRKPAPKLKSTYLKKMYLEIDSSEKALLDFLGTFSDKVTSVNPLAIPDPDDFKVFMDADDEDE